MSMKQDHLSWQEVANSLKFGNKRKIPHCTNDASAYVSNDPKGIRLFCFRCGSKEWESHGRMSAADILEASRRDEAEVQRSYPDVVPLYADEVPSSAHIWTLRAGLTPELATDEYGFGWSDKTHRVIVPVLHNFIATGGWTGRAIDGRKPKYILPSGSVGSCWYAFRGLGVPCAVVEDALSAIKIYRAGYSALAVFGTTVGPTQAMLLANQSKVFGWFDPDTAGTKGYIKLRKSLGPYGISPVRVRTDKDPKYYNTKEIQNYLGGGYGD